VLCCLQGLRESGACASIERFVVGKNKLMNGRIVAELVALSPNLNVLDISWNQYDPEAAVRGFTGIHLFFHGSRVQLKTDLCAAGVRGSRTGWCRTFEDAHCTFQCV
jgi:hypothetical protein